MNATLSAGDYYRAGLVLGTGKRARTITAVGQILDAVEGCEPGERKFLVELYANQPNLRWARSYSELCPEGEFGDVDRTMLERISKAEFDALLQKIRRDAARTTSARDRRR